MTFIRHWTTFFQKMKAVLIDSFISTSISLGLEYLLKKKIKNEAFHAVILPTVTQYSLEYIQLKRSGQTIGYKVMGLQLESQDGAELTSGQIVKRMMHRDTTSTLAYFRNRDGFEQEMGAVLPHDARTGTIVKEIN